MLWRRRNKDTTNIGPLEVISRAQLILRDEFATGSLLDRALQRNENPSRAQVDTTTYSSSSLEIFQSLFTPGEFFFSHNNTPINGNPLKEINLDCAKLLVYLNKRVEIYNSKHNWN